LQLGRIKLVTRVLLNILFITQKYTAKGILVNANTNRSTVTATMWSKVSHIIANGKGTAGIVIFVEGGIGIEVAASISKVGTNVFKDTLSIVVSVPWLLLFFQYHVQYIHTQK
jgi:hypothetical protein